MAKVFLHARTGKRNGGRPKRSCEKDVDDWMGASAWRVGQTAEDRLMYIQDPSRQQRPEMNKRKRDHRERTIYSGQLDRRTNTNRSSSGVECHRVIQQDVRRRS